MGDCLQSGDSPIVTLMEKRQLGAPGLPVSFEAGCMCPKHMHGNSDAGESTSRRSFAVGAATLLASLPAMLGTATAADAPPLSAEPAFQRGGNYSFMLGTIPITALSDGTVPANLHQLLLNTTAAHTDALLKNSFLVNPVEVSINEWVFRIDERLVLVDTGAGQLFGPGYGGKLLDSLSAAGFHPNEITDILITHVHTDHSGGLMRDSEMVFPKATIHVGQPDLTFFLDRSNAATAHYDVKYFDEAVKTIKPYLDAGRVNAFDRPTQIMPGLTATLNPGHTPGSAFYSLKNGSNSILFVGDVIHVAAVQFPDPNVAITYDVNPKAAVAVRQRLFPVFVHDRTLIAVPHMSFPGVGHVRSIEHGFEWVPIDYVNRI